MFHKFQFLIIPISLLFISCGDKQKIIAHSITDVQIEKTIENKAQYITLTAHVGGPGLYFNGDILSVNDPVTHQQIGSILVLNGEGGKNILRLKVNMNELTRAHSLNESSLPNKSPFPISDYDSILMVPAGEHSRIYLLKKNQDYTLGLAVVIPEFDALIDQITPTQLIFNLENQPGIGGFFTAQEKFQSGMLIFKPLDSNRRNWKTQKVSDQKVEIMFHQIKKWQKKKTRFRIK
jgi:hypothetical protein